jgi:hypothetical protein
MTPPRTPDYQQKLADMRAEQGALLDRLDIPGDWTPRQRDSYETQRSWFQAHIQDATNAMETLAKVEPQIAADAKLVADLTEWRALLCTKYLACPPRPMTPLARGIVRNLELSIQCIDRGIRVLEDTGKMLETLELGDLMRASGYGQSAPEPDTNMAIGRLPWFGALHVVEQRLKELQKQQADAEIRLRNALADPVTVTS